MTEEQILFEVCAGDHTVLTTEGSAALGGTTNPFWKFVKSLNLMRPDRRQELDILYNNIVAKKNSEEKLKKLTMTFHRMIILEIFATVGLSCTIAKYILEEDSSLSTALLASSPYILKDTTKLHKYWLRNLEEHIITDTEKLLTEYVTPLMICRGGREYIDVPLSHSTRLESNLVMCCGTKLILSSLIERVKDSNPGKFGSSQSIDLDEGVFEDMKSLEEEFLEIECLTKIIRYVNLMLSNPGFNLSTLPELKTLYDERCRDIESAFPILVHQNKPCVQYFIERLPNELRFPGLYDIDASAILLLPLKALRMARKDGKSIEDQREMTTVAFATVLHIALDCMYLNSGKKKTYREMSNFGQIFGRVCDLSRLTSTIVTCWEIDADFRRVQNTKMSVLSNESVTLIEYALKQLLSSEQPRWDMAEELLSVHFNELRESLGTRDNGLPVICQVAAFVYLRNDIRNWKKSLVQCRNQVKLLQVHLAEDQLKAISEELLKFHVELALSLQALHLDFIHIAVNSEEQDIIKQLLLAKIEIFMDDPERSENLLNSQSHEFCCVHFYVLLQLLYKDVNEASRVHYQHKSLLSVLSRSRSLTQESKVTCKSCGSCTTCMIEKRELLIQSY